MSGDPQDPASAGHDWAVPVLQGAVMSVSCNDVYSFTKPVRDEIILIAGLGVEGDVHAGVTVKHRGRVAADPTQPNLRQVHLIHAELHDEVRREGYDVPAGGLGENVTTSGLDLLALPRGTILRFGRPPTAWAPPLAVGGSGNGAASASGGAVGKGDGAERSEGAVGGDRSEGAVGGDRSEGAVGGDRSESAVGGGVESGGEPGPPPQGVAAVVAAAASTSLGESAAVAVAALVARIEAEPLDRPAADPRPAVVITGLRNPCQQINGYRSGLLKHVLGRDADGNLVRKAGIMGVVLRGGPVRPGDAVDVELPARPYLPLDWV